MALANASSCLSGEWALFNNAGGLAKVKQSAVSFSYQAYPSFLPFDRLAAVMALPIGKGCAATGVFRFGDDLYNELVVSSAFANTYGLASLGLKLNYIQYHAEGFGNTTAFTVSFGGIAQLTPHLSVGAHIVNINQPRLSPLTGERIPTFLMVGMAFQPGEGVLLTTELEKDLEHKPVWKAAFEYYLHKKLAIRTGVNLNPRAAFGGLGFNTKRFILDYAFRHDPLLGSSHQAGVTCHIRKK